nr:MULTISPECIES: efflux RND transporter periplasmic adaptor subunit [unclassified Prochlorococcus]
MNKSLVPNQQRALVVFTVLLLCACGKAKIPFSPITVSQTPVKTAQFTDDIDTVSTLEAKEEVHLAAQASGRIIELKIDQGDQVQPGQMLVVLDQAQIRAELADFKAQEQKNKLNWQRYEFLVPQGAASALDRDEYKAQYIASREKVKATEATLAYSNLRSPISGIVADVDVKVGDVIRSGDPFTKLIRNNRLLARVEVPATFSDRIKIGLPVFLSKTGSSDVMATGEINSVGPTVNRTTQGLLVKAAFENGSGSLRNGQRLRTRVQLDTREELSVPFAAVTQTSGQSFVYRVGSFQELEDFSSNVSLEKLRKLPHSTRFALQTPVTLGKLQKQRYAVVKGLKLGEQVITTNLLKLRHGMPISVKN